MKIAFDIGGVLSKYPDIFRRLWQALHTAESVGAVEVYIISDMHDRQKMIDMLRMNNMPLMREDRVHSADYKLHGEMCKAALCESLGIDILVDDFPGYVCTSAAPPVRLLVMPDPGLPYYADSWLTDGSEGDFGRRNPPGSKRPPEDRSPGKKQA